MAPDAFLQAIIDNPDDDGPRLIYADWLEEQGNPRGEFVRVQCQLAKEPGVHRQKPDGSPDWGECRRRVEPLRARERELWNTVPLGYNVWPGLLLALAGAVPEQDYSYAIVRRGFIDALTLPCASWLAHGPAIAAAHPVVRVTLSDKRPVKAEHVESYTWARHVRRGTVESWELPDDLFEQLLPDQRCVRVRDGIIMGTRDYESEADAFAGLSRSCLRWARSPALPAR